MDCAPLSEVKSWSSFVQNGQPTAGGDHSRPRQKKQGICIAKTGWDISPVSSSQLQGGFLNMFDFCSRNQSVGKLGTSSELGSGVSERMRIPAHPRCGSHEKSSRNSKY